MPLIIICGLPSSGKTYRAKQLHAYFEARINGKEDPVIDTNTSTSRNDVKEGQAEVTKTAGGGNGPALLTAEALSLVDAARDGDVKEEQEDGDKIPSANTARAEGESTSSHTAASSTVQQPSTDTQGNPSHIPPSSTPIPITPATPFSLSSPQQPTAASKTANPTPISSKKAKAPITIHHISDHSLHLPRTSYTTGPLEKTTRATLYSVTKRLLSPSSIVVLDTGNYIKGWRYQLYCEAKAAGTSCCVVYIGTNAAQAKQSNEARIAALQANAGTEERGEETGSAGTEKDINGSEEDSPWDPKLFDELVMRFEEPNAMARWDKPLYLVPWEDLTPPCAQIWEEIIVGYVPGVKKSVKPGVGTAGKGGDQLGQGQGQGETKKVVRMNQATVLTPSAPSTHLHALDRATQYVLSHITAYLQNSPPDLVGGGGDVSIPSKFPSELELIVHLPLTTTPSFAQLQRMRRQFLTLQRQAAGGLLGGKSVGQRDGGFEGMFVEWLNASFGGG